MARHGENIRKRKDGRWEGRYLVYSREEGRKICRSVYGKSYWEAKEKLIVKKYHLINEEGAENEYTEKKTDNGEIESERHKGNGNGDILEDDISKEHTKENASRDIFSEENVGGKVSGEEKVSGEVSGEENVGGEVSGEEKVSGEVSGEENVGGEVSGEEKVSGEVSGEENVSREVSGETNADGERLDGETAVGKVPNEENIGREMVGVGNAGGENLTRENRIEKSGRYKVNEGTAEKILEFSVIASEWLTAIRNSRKPSTYVKYQIIYRNYLEKSFKGVPLSAFSPCFVQEKISAPLSESIGKSIYCVLNQILNYGAEQYGVLVPSLTRPATHMPKKLINAFSRKEQSRLLAALYHKTDQFKAAILLCLHTGLRLGEVCALKWADIDVKDQFLLISRSVQRLYANGYQTKTALLEASPKSIHSRREIPLPTEIFKWFPEYSKEKEYVFGGEKPVEPRTMQNRFKKILKEAAVENKNFHALRHTFSTNCIEGGTDAKSLSELLGHSDVQITLNRYVHPSMDTKRRHLDGLSAFYAGISGQIYGQDCD